MNKMEINKLGMISYDEALSVMRDLHQKRSADFIQDTILVLQHPAVITKGRRLHGQAIPFQEKIEARGIQVRDADRGGLLTFHGPGQIVIYFVLKLQDRFDGISAMVAWIEQVLVEFLDYFDVKAVVDNEHPGVWVNGKKIASIGLRVSQGVTSHGLALNISSDLGVYQLFDPCGLSGAVMTNLEELLHKKISDATLSEMESTLAKKFAC